MGLQALADCFKRCFGFNTRCLLPATMFDLLQGLAVRSNFGVSDAISSCLISNVMMEES